LGDVNCAKCNGKNLDFTPFQYLNDALHQVLMPFNRSFFWIKKV